VDEGYLPIGRFARLCRLSVKQLRHYDDLGLLTPAYVSPDSGYRYYRPGQAREALLIGLLRTLDVPLPEIGRVLAGEMGALGGVRDRMEADLARRRRTLAALDQVLARGLPSPEVTLVREPPRRVAVVRDVAGEDQIGAVTSACMARLLAAEGPPTGLLIGLFPLDLTPPVPITVTTESERGTEVLPGGLYASAAHVGPYDQINLTAHAVLTWLADHGHTPGGPIREVYLDDPATTPPDRLTTTIMIKIEDDQ
jgi:DNA-binding transcriptional MerR regulator